MNEDARKRLQDRVDAALTPAETAALERELAANPALAAEASALDRLARLAAQARVAAPDGFADRVMSAIATDDALDRSVDGQAESATPRHVTLPRRGIWSRLFGATSGTGWLRPGLAGALALAALAVGATLLLVKLQNSPGPGRITTSQTTQLAAVGGGDSGAADDIVVHRFVLQAPDASKVCLVGDFNEWKLCEMPMSRDAEGHWMVELKLPRGRHQYMFVVDDRLWQTDPRADVKVDDGFGNQNAVVFL